MKKLQQVTGVNVVSSSDLIEATSDMGDFITFSGLLRRLAVKLSKIANDLRLLSSGPRGGFNDINLPAMQPGSSIMPGKGTYVLKLRIYDSIFTNTTRFIFCNSQPRHSRGSQSDSVSSDWK
jgi:aspartate ammonia-lyase